MKKILVLLFILLFNSSIAAARMPVLELTRIGDPSIVPLSGTFTGAAEIAEHIAEYNAAVRTDSVDVLHMFFDENGSAHVILRVQGEIRDTGNLFDIEVAKLIQMENGFPSKITIFYDTATWYAAFYHVGDVQDRRVVIPPHVGYTPGQSTQVVAEAYQNFVIGDIEAVLSSFSPTDFTWSLKGDAFGDQLGSPDQGVAHVGTWVGIGDWAEQPYPTTGFIGFLVAMSAYEYVMPEPPDYELPFQVKYIGSSGNYAGAHVKEIQRNLVTGEVAEIELYHLLVLDEEGKIVLGYSFHDDIALCKIDPLSAFYNELQ